MPRMYKSQPAKGWGKAAPRTTWERRKLLDRCGRKAFLAPDTLSYPVVAAKSRTCRPDCRGLLAAKRRADQYRRPDLARKAQRLAKQARCPWLP